MLCCVCLLENTKMIDIFDEKGKGLNIAVVIDTHFWFKVINVKLSKGYPLY